jgi:hypothetical protein
MADIDVTCANCGENVTISEYVDADLATCSVCGDKLFAAKDEPTPKKGRNAGGKVVVSKATLHEVPRSAKDPTMNMSDESVFTVSDATKARAKKRKKRKKVQIGQFVPGIGVILGFVVLISAVITFLRFGNALSESDVETFKQIGVCLLGFGHMAVMVDAFKDNAMYGLLCMFVPFYSLTYLYTKCDSLLLRAFVGMLLVPFLIDASLAALQLAQDAIQNMGEIEMKS